MKPGACQLMRCLIHEILYAVPGGQRAYGFDLVSLNYGYKDGILGYDIFIREYSILYNNAQCVMSQRDYEIEIMKYFIQCVSKKR